MNMATQDQKVVEVKPHRFDVLGPGFERKAEAPFAKASLKGGKPLPDIHDARFLVYKDIFREILGPSPKLSVLAKGDGQEQWAHEAAVHLEDTNELFCCSNRLEDEEGNLRVDLWTVDIASGKRTKLVPNPAIPMTTGATRLPANHPTHPHWLVLCAQGRGEEEPGGLVALNRETGESQYLLDNFHGTAFNSPNDVITSPDGCLFFSDPPYGYVQGFKPPPRLGACIYFYYPGMSTVRVVADGFKKPNGVALSKCGRILYVSDTGRETGTGKLEEDLPHTIYAYDIVSPPTDGFSSRPNRFMWLQNRRVFAVVGTGIPDGLQVHPTTGCLFAGTGGGVTVFDEAGELAGEIVVEGGIPTLAFAGPDTLILLHETDILKVEFS